MNRDRRLNILKTVPGLLVSAFFIWWTFFHRHADGSRGFDPAAFHDMHLVAPVWIAGILGFFVLGYALRCYRWYAMLRSVRARFSVCARVLLTSLAANNILPLRIGDVMRIFTYAEDLNATPSIVLSTVILEKFLDVFTLAVLFVFTMKFGPTVSPHVRLVAEAGVIVSTVGLLVMVFGARSLQGPLSRLFARTSSPRVKKLEHWLMLALDCIRQIGVTGTLLLVVYSFAAWLCECMMYLSFARLIGLPVDWIGPWQAMTEANLSFLIPSSPGGIGPFELACKDATVRHGATVAGGALYGLMVHAWLLISLTAIGGALFLAHRAHAAMRKPLVQELETLPVELP